MSRINERRQQAQAEPSREYVEKRAALVDAAAGVFRDRGYDGASINEIAAAAGTDRATVYYYFADKRDVFHEVIVDAVERNVLTAEAIAASDLTAAEMLTDLVSALLRSYERHYPYLFVYVQEDMTKLAHDDRRSSRKLRDLHRRYNTAVERIIRAGLVSGEFKPGLDPELISFGVLGAVNWTHRWFKPDKGPTGEEIARVFMEMILHGISAAPAPRHGREPAVQPSQRRRRL
ncbi:MAG TPA: TetR/AcrR family transcriptional regulator [Mycobacteriales bacterium]|nr:TetR/AcrR family transcriptional regulator [Mycobacteriales bacterium]